MSLFSLGNLFGSLGFHDTPASPTTSPVQPAASPDPVFTQALQASIDAQRDANALAAAAAVPRQDSESARAAGDDRRRRLLAGSNFGIGLPDLLGAPPVGFRMLSGE